MRRNGERSRGPQLHSIHSFFFSFFTFLMHFPSVTRILQKEISDSALYRLRKEMEEFHLVVGLDAFGKHQNSRDGRYSVPCMGSDRQSTVSFMAITCKHHREQILGQSYNEMVAKGGCSL